MNFVEQVIILSQKLMTYYTISDRTLGRSAP